MPFAIRDGVRLFWRLDGIIDKPPLVLLNSIGTDLSVWDRAMPYLLRDFRLLRMDARGHGASDVPVGDASLETLAADVLAVMDAAGVERAAVCGLSLGGMVAIGLALIAPDRIGALVAACTSARMDRDAWRARIETVRSSGMGAITDMVLGRFFSGDFRERHPETVYTVRTGLLGMNAEGYAGCGAAIRDATIHDMALIECLRSVTVACLVIAGSLDSSTPFEAHGNVIAEAIPGACAVTLAAGHLACLEAPDAFAAALRGFLLDQPRAPLDRAKVVLYEAGLRNRRIVLGDAWVDRALANRTPFNTEFQAMITRIAWQEVWSRPGLDHRTRRLLVLAITASLGRWEEFKLHVMSGLEQDGFTVEELKETLMQLAIYAGVPAANTAFAEAGAILRERDEKQSND